MEIKDFIIVPAIAILAYFVAEAYKVTGKDKKYVPIICGGTGLILGVLCFVLLKDYIAVSNGVDAAVVGLLSGWSATGVHQTLVQLKGRNDGYRDN